MDDPRSDLVADGEGDEGGGLNLQLISAFANQLRQYFRLFGVILLITLVVAALLYVFLPRTYEADALIGPPGPSPTDTMLMSVGGAAGGVAGRLLGGLQGSGGNDPYQEFLQLLPSTRLAQVLIEKDHLDRAIFYDKWDNQTHNWRVGPLDGVKNAVKEVLGMPITRGPTVDTLLKYFDSHLSVVGVSSGMASALIPGSSTYTAVSFQFDDPQQAESILDAILRSTDQIIREDQRRDVIARISKLESELSRVTVSDERSALIDVLTSQEQLLTMIQADQRYASTMIVPPYASPKQVFPTVVGLAVLSLFFSLLAWTGLVFLTPRSERIRRLTKRFKREQAPIK